MHRNMFAGQAYALPQTPVGAPTRGREGRGLIIRGWEAYL